MKIIATINSNNVMVQLTNTEVEKLFGVNYDLSKKIFRGDENGNEFELISLYDNLKVVKNVPKEIQNAINHLTDTIKYLDKAKEVAVKIDGLNMK